MCGIACAFNLGINTLGLRPRLLEMSKKLRRRGTARSSTYLNLD